MAELWYTQWNEEGICNRCYQDEARCGCTPEEIQRAINAQGSEYKTFIKRGEDIHVTLPEAMADPKDITVKRLSDGAEMSLADAISYEMEKGGAFDSSAKLARETGQVLYCPDCGQTIKGYTHQESGPDVYWYSCKRCGFVQAC